MRPFLAVLGGFAASLGMFGAGLALATYLLAVETEQQPGPSMDVADLWTSEPRRIDRSQQSLERAPAAGLGDVAPPAAPVSASVDLTETLSIEASASEGGYQERPAPEESEMLAEPEASEDEAHAQSIDGLAAAHMEWCVDRYRSYRQEDNSYTSYRGEQQPCVSPYTRELAQAERQEADEPGPGAPLFDREYAETSESYSAQPVFVEEAATVQFAVERGTYIESDHANDCFSRYRSYRPEDNTYQPFGGGPRRQCQ